MLYWSDLRIVDKQFTIKQNSICQVIFNNLSGVTYKVRITKASTPDPMGRLFYMSTADEFEKRK